MTRRFIMSYIKNEAVNSNKKKAAFAMYNLLN